MLQKQCSAFVLSKLLPDHIWLGRDKKPLNEKEALAKALTIAWKGKELGMPTMQAFSSISVINGKPTLSAESMLALIYQKLPGAKITFKTPAEKANTECVVEMQRPNGNPMEFRFSMEDAKRADLLRNQVWSKYPAAMLRARVVSAGARAVFPDAIQGCYTPEELHSIDAEFVVQEPRAQPLKPQSRVQVVNQSPPNEDDYSSNSDFKSPQDANRAFPDSLITDKQRKMLFALKRKADLNDIEFKDLLVFVCGDTVIGEDGLPHTDLVTRAHFQGLLDELDGIIRTLNEREAGN